VATDEDYIIEIDRATGNILNTWDLKQSLNEYRQTLNNDLTDWVHTNGIVYDATDNTIIISGRVQGVFKLTHDNHVKWVLGPHRGWGPNHMGQDLNQLLLTPLDSKGVAITDTSVLNGWTNSPDFEWNWYQHSPQLIPNGDLMVFDNGATRNFNPNESNYSRAVEYKIDESNMTVQQIWEYGKERGVETFSQIVSSVKYLPDNHVLFSPGFSVPNSTGYGGKIVEVDYATKNVVFQMSVSSANTWGWHRVQRMPIYSNGDPYK
jgi:arylsulfate sulfotransferase